MAVITYNGRTLEFGKDYKYSCASRSAIGTYEAKAIGIGDFTGEISAEWKIAKMYSVKYSANGKSYTKMYENKTAANVKAPNVTNKKFYRWETKEGKVLSYSQNYSFIVTKDVELVAQYKEINETFEVEPILNIEVTKTKLNTSNALYFEFTHSVPYEFTIQKIGILYGTNKLLGYTTGTEYAKVNLMNDETFDVKNTLITNPTGKVKNALADYKNNNGRLALMYSIGSNVDAYVYAMGYVIVTDKNGESHSFYSDIIATTYNNAN